MHACIHSYYIATEVRHSTWGKNRWMNEKGKCRPTRGCGSEMVAELPLSFMSWAYVYLGVWYAVGIDIRCFRTPSLPISRVILGVLASYSEGSLFRKYTDEKCNGVCDSRLSYWCFNKVVNAELALMTIISTRKQMQYRQLSLNQSGHPETVYFLQLLLQSAPKNRRKSLQKLPKICGAQLHLCTYRMASNVYMKVQVLW